MTRICPTALRTVAVLSTLVALPHAGMAASLDWSGVDLFWSAPAAWSPLGPPGANDDVRFFDSGAAPDAATINNTVSANTTIRSLWFGNTNGFHNMLIEPGVTLTVRGTNDNGFGRLGSDPAATAPDPNVQSTLYVGTKSEVSVSQIVTATLSGEGGTLLLDNTNNEVNIRQAWGGGGGAHRAILNMSGLGTFVANLSRIRVGDGEAGVIRRVEAQLFLARTNRISLSGPSIAEDVQLLVGNNDVNNNGNGSISYLYLGQDNILNVDHVLIGARKQQGNMSFQAGLTAPTLKMRGSDGSSRVIALRIGDESDQQGSGNPTTGRIDLSAGSADILADRVIIGKGQTVSGAASTGFLTMGAGNLDANTMEIAYQNSETASSAVTGTATFNGTTVVINDTLRMGRAAGSTQPRNAALNLNSGSLIIGNRLVNEGTTTSINITNSVLALTAGSPVAAGTIVLDGGMISNAAVIKATNSFVVANFATIVGSPIFDMGNSAATWDLQGIDGAALTVSNTILGSGTFVGDLIQAPGATISPGGHGIAGTLAVQGATLGGNVTLNAGALQFDLSNSGTAGNDQLTVGGTLTLNATNDVHLNSLGGVFDAFNAYTLITAGSLVGNQNNFRVAGALAQSRYTFTFDTTATPNSLQLSVGGSGPANLTWVGNPAANTWDLKTTANWTRGGPSAEQFFSLDAVTFNDFGAALPAVTLAGALAPGSITVNNSVQNYSFTGAGGLLGAPLTKQGTRALSFNNVGDNSFGGPVTIEAGPVIFANTGLNTFAGGLAVNGGSVALDGNNTNVISGGPLSIAAGTSLTVHNAHANDFGSSLIDLDGTFTIAQPVDSTLSGILSGGGRLIKSGAGTLTLTADNSALSTIIQIDGGTIKAGAPNALGITGVAISNGGALNVNGQNLTTLPVLVSGSGPDGSGALVNTAAPQLNALAGVTLAGDTTFGGSGPWNTDPVLNRGRWDIRNGSLNAGSQAFTLTKVGSNQVTLAGTAVDPVLGDINVQQGALGFEGATTSMGDPAKTLTVSAGATVIFFDTTTEWNKRFVLHGNGITPSLFNWNGANTIAGPVTLNGNCVIGGAPADRGTPISLTLGGPVSGTGGLTKIAADRLVLSGGYAYSGDTTIKGGTLALADETSLPNSPTITIEAGAALDVTGNFGGHLTLVSGQLLDGNGTVSGDLTAGAGATISPGRAIGASSPLIGTLTVIDGILTLQGSTRMDLDATLDTNDVLRASSITFGGTLQLENFAGTLSVGDSFKLFDATTYNGSFASITPATPAAGLTWDLSTLSTDGTLRVQAGSARPQIAATGLSNGAFVFSGAGGSPNGTYHVISSTNIALPLINWAPVLTNTFDAGGNFNVSILVDPNTRQRFFLLQVP
jgi:autotransporter-associated beta strand protein